MCSKDSCCAACHTPFNTPNLIPVGKWKDVELLPRRGKQLICIPCDNLLKLNYKDKRSQVLVDINSSEEKYAAYLIGSLPKPKPTRIQLLMLRMFKETYSAPPGLGLSPLNSDGGNDMICIETVPEPFRSSDFAGCTC